MKKYIYLFALVIGGSLMSCNDKLELTPFDSLETSLAFQTPTDFTNAVKGVYSRFRTGSFWGGWYQITPGVLSDNLILCSEGRKSKQSLHYWALGGNSTWSGLWTNGYRVAYRANSILENIDALESGDFKNNIQGEALALRAIAHYDMARIFAKYPQHAGAGDLGIPYMTSTDVEALPSRPSIDDSYRNIIDDLNAAKTLIGADNGVGRLNQTAVNAFLARIYLSTADYANAKSAADAAIGAGGAVSSRESFPMVWMDQTEEGVIFKVNITDADGDSPGVEYSQTGPTGVRSEYVCDYGLYQLFQDNDVRKSSYLSTSDFAGKTFNHIAKYFGRPGSDVNVTDIKMMRWAEVYLTRAEALAEMGSDGLALADLDAVRTNRYEGFTSGSETGTALKDAIALERRLELAFEGDRFFDLKRKGLAVNRSTFGDEADGSGISYPAGSESMSAGDDRFQLPIPQDELNANENMSQNPGY